MLECVILGSGTSTGVPIIGCDCHVCTSENPKDKRFRASLLFRKNETTGVIDTGPDFRAQMLRENVRSLDGVLYTHIHYDHVGGFDDLRPFCFRRKSKFPCYADSFTIDELYVRYPYIRVPRNTSSSRPEIEFIRLQKEKGVMKAFNFHGIHVQPIEMIHVKEIDLRSYGYVLDRRIGYITDFKEITEPHKEYLKGLEVLVIGTPLSRHHPTHCSIPEAVAMREEFKVQSVVLTHLSHQHSHQELEEQMPQGVIVGYDGLIIREDGVKAT